MMPDIAENDLYRMNEFTFSMPAATTTTTTFDDDEVAYQSCRPFELIDLTGRFFGRTIQDVRIVTELPAFRLLLEVLGSRIFSKTLVSRESIAPLQDSATASLFEDVSTTSGIVEHNLDLITSENFKLTLSSELDAEPVEDGIRHKAEQLINNAAASLPNLAPRWIEELFSEMLSKGRMTHAAGLLQCLGRTRSAPLRTIGSNLITLALAQPSVEVREAAVTIVEQWGGEDVTLLLQGHSEPVPWLTKYIEKVQRDLTQDRK